MKALTLTLLVVCMAGCTASNLYTLNKTVTLSNGTQVEAMTVEASAPAGLNSRAHYLFQDGKLLAANAVGGEGLVNNMFKDSVGSAIGGTAVGLGIYNAGKVMKAATVNVGQ
ncbi:MAG: hypothetical protein ACLPT6_09195 [Desulfobaccales bacterium]